MERLNVNAPTEHKPHRAWRDRLFEIIFEADTPAGKWFDLVLIVLVLLSVLVVMLDSVASIHTRHGRVLFLLEWGFTILFTIDYILRLLCVARPLRYAVSFYGLVDLMAIIPTYLSLLIYESRYLSIVRILRVLRIFRILKLGNHTKEAGVLRAALYASRRKILVFFSFVVTLVVIIGALMYMIEGSTNVGFTSIPQSVYWAIVTMTTVGYGDISPQTPLGKLLASIVMILGYSIIAVPTGIVTVQWSQESTRQQNNTQVCPNCSAEGHDNDARHCKFCGAKL
jgi:voltage-gated potassium channel